MLERLAGPFVGLCHPPQERLNSAGGPRLCEIRTRTRDAELTVGFEFRPRGAGRSLDRRQARDGALGEAFERYSLAAPDPSRLQFGSVRELTQRGNKPIAPAKWCSFTEDQYADGLQLDQPPADDKKIFWLPGIDLATAQDVMVPADVCLFSNHNTSYVHVYDQLGVDQPRWFYTTSNGAAVAADPFTACLSGLLELLERDAFMLMWYHHLRFPHVRFELDGPVGRTLDWILRPARAAYQLIDLSAIHSIPTIIAVVWRKIRDRVVYGFGGAAALDVGPAAVKAVTEGAGSFNSLRKRVETKDIPTLTPAEVRDFTSHTLYYLDPAHQPSLEFLFDPPTVHRKPGRMPKQTSSSKQQLRALAATLHAEGIETIAVDVTPIEGPAVGLVSYKVVSPQLIPLDGDHNIRPLGNLRLLTEPVRRGWRVTQPSIAELNHHPHPFP